MTIPFGYGDKADLYKPDNYVLSPFFVFLTDDGTDYTLNENYASATDAYFEAKADALITAFCVSGGDTDVAQATAIANAWYGTTVLSNGLKFCIKDSSGRVTTDITVTQPLRTTSDLLLFATFPSVVMSLSNSSTSLNNELIIAAEVNCIERFGGCLYLPKGHRFVCTLQDNFSGMDGGFLIGVSGHYV